MPELFLDIETVPDMSNDEYFKAKQDVESGTLNRNTDSERFWKYERGGLTPFAGKVILITYKINNGYMHRLTEWESNEYEILKKFYLLIKDLQKGYDKDRLKIVGHNILGFDLFFLYRRMVHHKLDEEKWIYQNLINGPEIIDFLPIHMPLNNYNTKGLKHDVLAFAYEFPTKETSGGDEILHYYNKEYHKIIEYSQREFIYPELYQKIKSTGLVSQQRLKESISWYDKAHNIENQT